MKEESSEKYIQGKLRDHKEFPLCDDRHRMRLITKDLYDIQQAFEDGWEEACTMIMETIHDVLIDMANDNDTNLYNPMTFDNRLREALKMKGYGRD